MKEIIYLVVIQSEAKNLDNIIVDVTEILRFALNDKTEKKFLLLINLQVRNLALEVSGLFEREYQGADIADACLAFLVHPAFLNVQFFHLLAVDEEAGSLVVTFDGNLHALARLNIISKGIQVTVACIAKHTADRVRKVEYSIR